MTPSNEAGSGAKASVGVADVDAKRLSRRTAMKAALGGVVASGVFLAPRIEGLSIVPDYAAAASCTSGSSNTGALAANDCNNLIGCCWGNEDNAATCACGNKSYNLSASGITMTGNYGGGCNGDNGFVNFAVSGIDPPFQSCTASVTGTCTGSSGVGNVTWRSSNTSGNGTVFNQVFNADGSGSTLTDCNGNLASFANNANLQISFSCTCS